MAIIKVQLYNLRGHKIGEVEVSKDKTISDLAKLAMSFVAPNHQPVLFYQNKLLESDSIIGEVVPSEAVLEISVIPTEAKIQKYAVIGGIDGLIDGQILRSRDELLNAGVHTELVDNICGHPKGCAVSIVYTGENERDEDHGKKILFTGLGQELTGMNEALARNCPVQLDPINGAKSQDLSNATPVRVIRKLKFDSPYENEVCYRYDGIYKVSEYRPIQEEGGRRVWLFTLVRDDNLSNRKSKNIFKKKREIEPSALLKNPTIPKEEIRFWQCKIDLEVGKTYDIEVNLDNNIKILEHDPNSYSLVWSNEEKVGPDCPVNIIPFTGVKKEQLNDYNISLAKKCCSATDYNKGNVADDWASGPDVKVFEKLSSKGSIRFHGLYKVYAVWIEENKENGMKIWRFLLKNSAIPVQSPERAKTQKDNENIRGPINGIVIGSFWATRQEVAEANVHPPLQAGICGIAKECAYSIVLSGEYEGDFDYGDIILYSGSGGRNEYTKKGNDNQYFTKGNQALARNCDAKFNEKGAIAQKWQEGISVRVVRKLMLAKSIPYRRDFLFRYEGIYKVAAYWLERRDKFLVGRFLLKRYTPSNNDNL